MFLVFVTLQATITYIWVETDMIDHFSDFFRNNYRNGIPTWSGIAFSIGMWWFVSTVISIGLFIYGSVFKKTNYVVLLSIIISSFCFFSMCYAMYPIHLMLTDVMI